MRSLLIAVTFVAFLTSCSVEPEPIHYGEDQCDFCKMGVVDRAHSAQYTTNKGKQFKYDSNECLIRDLNSSKVKESDLAFILVADYPNPGEMIDVRKATFVVSKAIKSPMGAYLSAFSNADDAKAVVAEKGGEVYDWEGIKAHILKN